MFLCCTLLTCVMKPKDRQILYYMRTNARMNLTTISRKTGIPVSTIFDRIRAQQGGLIRRFTCLLDFKRLGYNIWAKALLKVQPEKRDELRKYLMAHPNVNNVQRINNGYDYSVDFLFTDMKEAEDFMDGLETRFPIVSRNVFHVIDSIVEEKIMADGIMS